MDPATLKQRDKERSWCQAVIGHYHAVLHNLENPQAVDYSKKEGGAPKYKPPNSMFDPIHFVVDVERTAKSVLGPVRWAAFRKKAMEEEADLSVQSVQFIKDQQQLGRSFRVRGLHPLNKYFKERSAPCPK